MLFDYKVDLTRIGNRSLSKCMDDTIIVPELSVGWVDPWVGFGWVGSGMGRKFVFLVSWVGSWI